MKTNPSIVDSAFRRERGKWMSASVSVCTVFVYVVVSAAAAVSFAQTRCWRIDFAAGAIQTELGNRIQADLSILYAALRALQQWNKYTKRIYKIKFKLNEMFIIIFFTFEVFLYVFNIHFI